MVRVSLLVVILFFTAVSYADVVVLRNGHRIEGEVTELNGRIEVRLLYGSVFIKKEEVLYIEKRLTPWQEFERRLKEIDGDDWQALGNLLLWCKRKGLREEANRVSRILERALREEFNRQKFREEEGRKELKRIAYWCKELGFEKGYEEALSIYWRMYVEAELKKTDITDAKTLVMLALRLKMKGVPQTHLRVIFEMALLSDPNCLEARIGVGMQLFEGLWLHKSQVDAILKRRYDERMAKSGYVFCSGKWVRPDAVALMEKERRLRRLEKELELEKERLRNQRIELNFKEKSLEDEKRDIESRCQRYECELSRRDAIIKNLRWENWRLARWVRELRNENRYLKDELKRLRREIERLKDNGDSRNRDCKTPVRRNERRRR